MNAGRQLLIGAMVLLLAACGGGGGGGDTDASTVDPAAEVISDFSGSVGDGPIVGATLKFYDRNGRLLKTNVSDSNASYSTRIKAKRSAYPITVEASGGIDLVTGREPDFTLTSIVLNHKARKANINPFSTIIVESARRMSGGLSEQSIEVARRQVVEKMNYGLDTQMIPDPIVFEVSDDNIAAIVKSSEALGEMIRRTRDEIRAGGADVDGDDIVGILSADIADGEIDGRIAGAPQSGVNLKVSVISKLNDAQVLIESLSNSLKVDGVVARGKMDEAVMLTRADVTESQLTDSVRINAQLLDQLRDVLDTVQSFDAGAGVTAIVDAVNTIPAGSSAADAEAVLPAESSDEILNAINLASSATDDQLSASQTGGGAQTGDGTTVNDDPPVVTTPPLAISGTPPTRVAQDNNYAFAPSVSGGTGTAVAFSIRNKPTWMAFNPSTGRMSGVPGNLDVGTYRDIVVSASENGVTVSLPSFDLSVTNVNDAPSIAGNGSATMNPGQFYSFQPSASDPDGDTLVFSIANRPSWASFDTATGLLSGTPGSSDAGSYGSIAISVSDGATSASLPAFSITVSPVVPSNQAPTIGGSPATSVAEGASYAFQPSAADADGDVLSFSIANRPSWTSFNTSTGRLSGTPDKDDAGSYGNIVISVSDGQAVASLAPFTINVTDVNSPPTISGTPSRSVNEGADYSFQPTASDTDGDTLVFSIANKPAWASFNTATGRLSGTPGNADVGEYTYISISVSDGKVKTSMAEPFAIKVLNVNGAPVISGTPPGSVEEATAYVFQPSATDPDGDTLTYSISNRPAWASFDSATGRLSGTPTSLHVGTYGNIVVSVSDGTSSVSLAPFAITVTTSSQTTPTTGSITLNWNPPVQRTNGQALAVNDVAEYTVYYGTTSGNYSHSVTVSDPYASSTTIDALPLGTYYVVLTTTDTGGRESGYSNEVLKQAQ